MPVMRAKLRVTNLTEGKNDKDTVVNQTVVMAPVTSKPFDKEGICEDNTYAKWTPSGRLELFITNPALFGVLQPGQTFYVDFTEAEPAPVEKAKAA